MKVFTYYDASLNAPPEQASLVTLWERSWRNHGWHPRLISARHAKRSSLYKKFEGNTRVHPLLAMQACGGGLLVPMYVMNLGFAPSSVDAKITSSVHKFPFEIYSGTGPAFKAWLLNSCQGHKVFRFGPCAGFGSVEWKHSPLVFFPDPNKILTCGRAV